MPHHSTLCYFHHCTTVIPALLHTLNLYNTWHHCYTTAYTTSYHHASCIISTPCYITSHLYTTTHCTTLTCEWSNNASHLYTTIHCTTLLALLLHCASQHATTHYIMLHCPSHHATSWIITHDGALHHALLCITPCYITLHLCTTPHSAQPYISALHYLHYGSTVHHPIRYVNSITCCTIQPS